MSVRYKSIDSIRGFSLLGILLVNMPDFYSPHLYMSQEKPFSRDIASFSIDVLARASFYPLFAMLFGFGFMMMFENARKQGHSFSSMYRRRLVGLFLLGCIHAFLIWYGDILISYALCGAVLWFFKDASVKRLLTSGLVICLIPVFIVTSLLVVSGDTTEETGLYQHIIKESFETYASGTFGMIVHQRLQDWLYLNNIYSVPFLFVSIFPFFLFGAAAAKARVVQKVENYVLFLKGTLLLSACFFLLGKLLPYIVGENAVMRYVHDSIGGPAGSLFYGSFLLLILRKKVGQKLMSPFAAMGKLSLTNYLGQSVLSTLLFYSYGAGLYGKISTLEGIGITFFIFWVQMIVSNWWMKNHLFGPIEWLLRSFIRRQKQPWKRAEIEQN
ncbi:DUF418 domain-containing protein [Priestia koreensis]|uniref:DUF418 domain-containing protein n=1 Tax=Priestia koreensis TaxID=284581 RepID=A0A0M0LHR8_9BACI|nr:DUF418 domain-containing protein [Priestia koreensis]KOO50258.1 hypothetical protein AMD01_00350 [Priestia koreensis]